MSYYSNAKDIFLWADGYWCYREDFPTQPRHNYAYRLVAANSADWRGLTGAEPYSRTYRNPVSGNAQRGHSQPPNHTRS